jgi:murein DD-endopeptidase MepM/ murein hydrolase activator NlpD
MNGRMRRLALLLLLPSLASAQDVYRQVGSLTIAVDRSHAYPGGLLVVRLHSRRPPGTTFAILDGRRTPFFPSSRGPRALVPIPATAIPGEATLGIEIIAHGRQRIPVQVAIGAREFPSRAVVIDEDKRSLLAQPAAVRDSRRLLAALRTVTLARQWNGPLRPPVDLSPEASFGSPTTYVGGSPVEAMMDGIYGEYHRGLDYNVPAGTLVQAPGAGTVVLAGALTLTGQTLVIDHGQGILSAIFHLGRIEVREGDRVESRAPVGLSGQSGLALAPHVHWGTYVSGVAVDPRVLAEVLD